MQARCLGGCKRTVAAPPGSAAEPALCEFCAAEEGKEALVRPHQYHVVSRTKSANRCEQIIAYQDIEVAQLVIWHSAAMLLGSHTGHF